MTGKFMLVLFGSLLIVAFGPCQESPKSTWAKMKSTAAKSDAPQFRKCFTAVSRQMVEESPHGWSQIMKTLHGKSGQKEAALVEVGDDIDGVRSTQIEVRGLKQKLAFRMEHGVWLVSLPDGNVLQQIDVGAGGNLSSELKSKLEKKLKSDGSKIKKSDAPLDTEELFDPDDDGANRDKKSGPKTLGDLSKGNQGQLEEDDW